MTIYKKIPYCYKLALGKENILSIFINLIENLQKYNYHNWSLTDCD